MSKITSFSTQIPLLIFSLLLCTSPFHVNSQANTNPEEQTTLLKLKDHWSINHWTQSSDHCTWPEITCTNGMVTKIRVVNQTITGTIPPVICDLKNLTTLDLQSNNLSGPFPTALYNCSQLEYLNLPQNSFNATIPGDIDRLSQRLEYLNLGDNKFTGDIPAAIGRFPRLKSLQLQGNLFDGSFPSEIGNLSNLEELVLNFNGFAPQAIPSSFTKLKKLRNLWMTTTNLIGEIPVDIGNMTALEYLDLSANGLTGSIPGGLFLLKNLSILYLYKNKFSGSIPSPVEALNLEVIDLSENNLLGAIPDDFGKLTKLTGLALFFNQLSGPVPASIGRLPALLDVKLFGNKLSGELPPDFGRYSMLRGFEVATNNFFGQLPEYLCSNGALIGVIAFDNNLTGGLPKSLANCDSLLAVHVYGNQLSGTIPDGLWAATNLIQLLINDNLFTGQLPKKVASNFSLLDMSNNQFSGEIPIEVSSWNNLREFKASNNLLSGKIPQELTDLPELTTLFLDGNRLSGNLPTTIISWKSLTALHFSRNQLSGQIPAGIGSLPVLTELDFSANKFSGEIPPEIGRLRPTFLNLSSNDLSGRIPGELENAAFDKSFLENPGLCATNPSLGLRSCASSRTRISEKLSSQFIAAVSSIAAVAFLVSLLYTFFLIRNYRKRKHSLDSTWKLTSFQKLDFTESTILSSLAEANVIGSGGSGKVYRVPVNRLGGYVAVKKICNNKKIDERLEKEFLAEVQILGSIRHSNIVKLMCCLSTENSNLLVYEYMENRSLDRWLHCKKRQGTLSGSVHHVVLEWPRRLQIAIAAARGLSYMHHDCSSPIIHRDVKSSNILLDSEFNAKIADFGLARILDKDGGPNTMSVVAGSFGYIAPEYAQTKKVNEKIDVYSFGVILLELVTGQEANEGDENSSLAEWAWRHVQEERPIVDAIDKEIDEPCYLDEIITVFKLGIFCTHPLPSNRPSMKDVLQVLLQCANPPALGEKTDKNEFDVAPLLGNSKREKSMDNHDDDDDDASFNSLV